MKINLLLFGLMTDITGNDQLIFNDVTDINDLLSKIENDHPEMKKATYRIAVNKELVNGNAILHDGDEVALLPPFSGG